MTTDPDQLEDREILKINQELAKRGVPYAGSEEYPIKKEKIEHLVKNTPTQSPIDVAAYYLKNLALLQPFPNGNHRMALIAAEIYLKRKGYRFDYTANEANQLKNQMLKLQYELYGTYEEQPKTVITEPDNKYYHLCHNFIKEHATRTHPKTRPK